MGFWSTLGKIGSIAAPIVAAPFTGGASLALIGAGSGAALGALNGGGIKGSLLGAGLGGATAGLLGGAGGGAASAAGNGATQMGLGSTLSQIGKNLLNPDTLSKLGGVAAGAAQGSASGRRADSEAMIGAQKANNETQVLNDRRTLLSGLLGGLQDASISRPEGSTIPTFGITGGLRPSAISNKEALMQQLGQQIKPLDMPTAGVGEKILGGVGLGGSLLGALGNIAKKPAASYQQPQAPAGVPSMPWTLPGTGSVMY